MEVSVEMDSFRRGNHQPCPAGQKTETAKRRDRAQCARIRQSHRVQTPAENNYPREKQPPRAAICRSNEREHEQRDRVNEMIKHRLIPNVDHIVRLERRL